MVVLTRSLGISQRSHLKIYTRQIPLNFRVQSYFRGEFLHESNELFHGSDIERCFSAFLYPLTKLEDDPPNFEYSQAYESDDVDWDCPCGG